MKKIFTVIALFVIGLIFVNQDQGNHFKTENAYADVVGGTGGTDGSTGDGSGGDGGCGSCSW